MTVIAKSQEAKVETGARAEAIIPGFIKFPGRIGRVQVGGPGNFKIVRDITWAQEQALGVTKIAFIAFQGDTTLVTCQPTSIFQDIFGKGAPFDYPPVKSRRGRAAGKPNGDPRIFLGLTVRYQSSGMLENLLLTTNQQKAVGGGYVFFHRLGEQGLGQSIYRGDVFYMHYTIISPTSEIGSQGGHGKGFSGGPLKMLFAFKRPLDFN